MTAEEFVKKMVASGGPLPPALAALADALGAAEITQKDVKVVREGQQITLPPKMSYDEGIEWLKRKKQEEERDVGIAHEFSGSPLDGAVAFHKALARTYGWADLVPTPGFFGSTPPTMISVPTGVGQKIQVPWGRVQIPGVAGFLETGFQMKPVPRFYIGGQTKQKNAAEVKAVLDLAEKIVLEESIYRGKAVRVSFQWERDDTNYHPLAHAPQYFDIGGVAETDLVLPADAARAIGLGLFAPIEHAAALRAVGVPLKRGVLMHGKYGVGKSLASAVTALKATAHGWTFVYLGSVDDLERGLQFAAQYAPAVVFVEDIDRAVAGERTTDMDAVLNILDGVDTKGREVLTVFTSNDAGAINPALLRPGRLDTVIEITPPDADAAVRLVKLYGRGLLAADTDYGAVGHALAGHIPAFIRETVERAKIAAVVRTGGSADIAGQVGADDLLAAAGAMRAHAAMLDARPKAAVLRNRVMVEFHPDKFDEVRDLISANGDGVVEDDGDEE